MMVFGFADAEMVPWMGGAQRESMLVPCRVQARVLGRRLRRHQ
jgi:hypothetical protein